MTTWFCLLWGMALLGLLLLPSNYRAGAESAHAHSLAQLWTDAGDGSIHHHGGHALPERGSSRSSSWFDPAVGETGTSEFMGFNDPRPDVAEQQESAPVSSGVHLLLTAMMAIVTLVKPQAPIAVPARRQRGLSPRILVPPPRWTTAAY